ncbi:MAG: FmdB family zinc ribbon protein [Chloroflexota bacterium]|nr:zinc ribbon domain-containing protein [Dehalococcoidales bacterium]
MPIYEYVCQGCQRKFELMRSFSRADDPVTCPHCQGEEVKRAISNFCSFSKDASGATSSVGGSSCSGCSSGSCASCGR